MRMAFPLIAMHSDSCTGIKLLFNRSKAGQTLANWPAPSNACTAHLKWMIGQDDPVKNVGSADHPASPTISVWKWKPWPQMRHCTQSSCGMGITMEDLTWHPWHLGGHRATGHPTDLGWSFLQFTGEAKRRKRFIEFAWICMNSSRKAWLEVT